MKRQNSEWLQISSNWTWTWNSLLSRVTNILVPSASRPAPPSLCTRSRCKGPRRLRGTGGSEDENGFGSQCLFTLSYTESEAKLVRWSHSHTVPLLALDTKRQPSDDQLPPSSLDLQQFQKYNVMFRCIGKQMRRAEDDNLLLKVPIHAFGNRFFFCWLK